MTGLTDIHTLRPVRRITSILISRFLIHLQEVGGAESSIFQSLSHSIEFENRTTETEGGPLQDGHSQQLAADRPEGACAVLQRDDSGVSERRDSRSLANWRLGLESASKSPLHTAPRRRSDHVSHAVAVPER